MVDTQHRVTHPRDRNPEQHEEYELNRIGTTQIPAPSVTASTTPPKEHVDPRAGIWTKIGFPRPPHIHYVPIQAARDHLANERVFLAYIRTSSALANFAVAILQLYRLKHDPAPKRELSDYDLGIPLATVALFLAIAITIAGTWRFFVCQSAMARRKRIATSSVVVLVFIPALVLLLLILFIFTIIVNPDV